MCKHNTKAQQCSSATYWLSETPPSTLPSELNYNRASSRFWLPPQPVVAEAHTPSLSNLSSSLAAKSQEEKMLETQEKAQLMRLLG
jgi:hypothetical protein